MDHNQPTPDDGSRLPAIRVVQARPDDAALVHRIMRAAFAEYLGVLDPPSGSNDETVEDVRRAIASGGALLAWDGDVAVGSARYEPREDVLYVGRVSVLPEYRRKGVASALMQHAELIARQRGLSAVEVGVRASLPSNVGLYQQLGFVLTRVDPHPRGPDQSICMVKRTATSTNRK